MANKKTKQTLNLTQLAETMNGLPPKEAQAFKQNIYNEYGDSTTIALQNTADKLANKDFVEPSRH